MLCYAMLPPTSQLQNEYNAAVDVFPTETLPFPQTAAVGHVINKYDREVDSKKCKR